MNVKFIDFFIDELNYGNKLIQFSVSQYLRRNYGCDVNVYDTRKIFNWDIGNFNDFDSKYLMPRVISSIDDIKHDDKTTDLFMFPGDQVWNLDCRSQKFFHQFFTLPFISKSKKISYAVSDNGYFKNTSNNGKINDFNRLFLQNIKYISVRDKETYDFLRKNGIESRLDIDGVFLTTIDQWKKLFKKPDGFDEKDDFDLYYYLRHDKFAVDETRKHAIVIGNYKTTNRIYSVEEWLWLVYNCKTIYTNSFHGCCFGLMFNKRIIIENEKDYRIKNLFSMLGADMYDKQMTNYDIVCQKINEYRNKSKQYFDEIFKYCQIKRKQYAAYSKDYSIRNISTSGGVCGEFARITLSKPNSCVYGVRYSDDFKSVKYSKVTTLQDYFKYLVKSKYSYARLDVKDQIQDDLKSGKNVLFIGCPCHIKELTEYLGFKYTNLVTVSLQCYGCSKPEILRKFIEDNEKKNVLITGFDMRPNHSYNSRITYSDGDVKEDKFTFKRFLSRDIMMDKCQSCCYHKLNDFADIIVGDFWDYGKLMNSVDKSFDIKLGTNLILVNNLQGSSLVDVAIRNLSYIDLNQYNLSYTN